MKRFTVLFFIFFSFAALGQDGHAWFFKFKFKINTTETIRYEYKNLEVFVNDSYTDERLRDYKMTFDPSSKEYMVTLRYDCISCGYKRSDFPPELYLKVNLDLDRNGMRFSSFIPIYFNKSESFRNREFIEFGDKFIDIGTIELKHFITGNFWNDSDIEDYDIIEFTSTDSKYYRKAGAYKPRRMNRLIKIDFEK